MDSDNQDMAFGDLKDANPYAQYGASGQAHAGYPDRQPGGPGDDPPSVGPPTGKSPPPSTPAGFFVNSVCWLLITLVVLLVLYLQNYASSPDQVATPEGDLANLLIQAKFSLGLKSVSEKTPELKKQQADQPNLPYGLVGSVRNRQAGAVMLAELETSQKALDVLEIMEDYAQTVGYSFSQTEQSNTETLRKIFAGEEVSKISDDRKELLREELLWFGELALHPKKELQPNNADPARRKILENSETVFFTLAAFALLGVGALLVGIVGAIAFLFMYSTEKLKIRTAPYTQQPTVYLESFTVWLCAFIGFSVVLGSAVPDFNPLVANLLVFALSFFCGICWPLFRGGGAELRQDVGFTGNPLTEAVVAVWCYVCSLPLVLLGFIVTLSLLVSTPSSAENDLLASGPGHPLIEWVMKGDPSTIVLVFAVACIGAPIVEETFFRGFFYRALKDNSFRLGRLASVCFSALVNGLVFAAIHPQGIFFIPVLCSLGMAFSFAREWRGSLWTPMVMHAIHNGILTTILVVAMTQ